MSDTDTGLNERMVSALGQLRGEIDPPRDLWPGISARLAPREHTDRAVGRAWRWPALAATVAVAFAVGVLLGRQGDDSTRPMPESGPVYPGVAVALRAAEQEYLAEWKGFTTVGVAPTLLAPRTLVELEASWNELLQAETALLTALDEHPDNPYLGEKLLDLRAQQLEFMRQLHMLDQNSRRET